MLELFFQSVSKRVALTPEEEDICREFFVAKKIRKRQFILRPGEVCDTTIFVEKGLLRSYTVDERGHEYILQFAPEGWWIGDLYSFTSGEASIYNIEAVEDTEIQQLGKEDEEEMIARIPKLERFFRIKFLNACAALQRRMTLNISENTAGKYAALVRSYPDIVQRVPQHMIASYLGVSPEALSRVRKQTV